MAVTICLKMEKVPGESSVSEHKGEIDVLSWNWGLTQSASAHVSTGAGTGSADVKDLTITKYLAKSSPNLLTTCCIGANHKDAVRSVMKATGKGGEAITRVKITMA